MTDSDFIIYVDESGDHSLVSIDSQYPIFVLVFCIIDKSIYPDIIREALRLKFATFGHDMTILHEREIRKRIGEFAFINSDPLRGQQFLSDVTSFVANCKYTLIAAIIHKTALVGQYMQPDNPYEMALTFCLERAYGFLKDASQQQRSTHVVVESRGRKEDNDLELAFRRTCAGNNYWSCALPFSVRFSNKQCNSTGMQLADLVARPIGQEFLKPGSQKRIYPSIVAKFRRSSTGKITGWGLKTFP